MNVRSSARKTEIRNDLPSHPTNRAQLGSYSCFGGFNYGSQSAAGTYTFNNWVNAYGQTYNQVFGNN